MREAPSENPHAGQGMVMLDIGGDVGALVVTMPDRTLGTEVEIRPVGVVSHHSHGHSVADPTHDHVHDAAHEHQHDHGRSAGGAHLAHVAVVARPVGDGMVPSLVFPELREGGYDLFEKGRPEAVTLSVEVEGGRVTYADWPAG
jgi:hypothetical protein